MAFSKDPADPPSESGEHTASSHEPQAASHSAPATDITALALAARGRDFLAVRLFLEAIAQPVRSVCRSVLGARHMELDDVVQESLLEIVRALKHYRGDGPALHYAKRIALRAAIMARTRSRKRGQRAHDVDTELRIQAGGVGDDNAHLALVREVLDLLPAMQAEAILMRSILGLSIEEIARATQVPVNTAKSRLRLAKETLRHRFKQRGGVA